MGMPDPLQEPRPEQTGPRCSSRVPCTPGSSDIRISARQLAKTPGFTVAAIVVLALGIGLNAAMFSLVHALAIAGRPFAEPDRLVQLYTRDTRD